MLDPYALPGGLRLAQAAEPPDDQRRQQREEEAEGEPDLDRVARDQPRPASSRYVTGL